MKKKISLSSIDNVELSLTGLTPEEIQVQKKIYGFNRIIECEKNTVWLVLKDSLLDPMILFFLLISILYILIKEYRDAAVLGVAIVPLLMMDFILHWRTHYSTKNLASQLSARTLVIRSGIRQEINSHDLVPGDLVVLRAGDYISADGIIEKSDMLQVDESALTGEAYPIIKKENPILIISKTKEINIDNENLGYAGTRVLTGNGLLRVIFVGKETEYGIIVNSLQSIKTERTPLQKSISELVKRLIIFAIISCFVLAAVRFYQNYGWVDSLVSAATLAIAAIPEEFPVVFTFFLGLGVYRLSKKKAWVRRSVIVENIGRISIICTDKTGTITTGKLKLYKSILNDKISENQLLEVATGASDSEGIDPVDQAIFERAIEIEVPIIKRSNVIPFTEEKRFETAFIPQQDGSFLKCIKGAPELILSVSKLNQSQLDLWLKQTIDSAKMGYKIIACSSKKVKEIDKQLYNEPLRDFQLMGLLLFVDPARPEVFSAINYCNNNDIKVLMFTGDHRETAYAVAKEIGLGKGDPIVLSASDEPDKLKSACLEENIEHLKKIDVIARCTPLQKLEIVKALKKSGELVAVTGDGINDVPALKAADVGIAMGERGSRSAKEVSSIILADDNFQTIVNAIIEGRKLFKSLKNSFEYLILIHIPFVVSAAAVPLLGFPLLYLPIHVVWLELIIHPSMILAFQRTKEKSNDKSSNQLNPRKPKNFFTKSERAYIFFAGILMASIIVIIYINAYNSSSSSSYPRSKAMAALLAWSAGLVMIKTRLRNWGAFLIFLLTLITSVYIFQIRIFDNILQITQLNSKDFFTLLVSVGLPLFLIKIIKI